MIVSLLKLHIKINPSFLKLILVKYLVIATKVADVDKGKNRKLWTENVFGQEE